jgi:hypothetical protein
MPGSRVALAASIGQSAVMDNDRRANCKKKQWSELSPRAKGAIVAGAAVEVVVTTIALRDLIRRSSTLVRGPKLLWLFGLFVQPVGAPLYLTVGRRPSS